MVKKHSLTKLFFKNYTGRNLNTVKKNKEKRGSLPKEVKKYIKYRKGKKEDKKILNYEKILNKKATNKQVKGALITVKRKIKEKQNRKNLVRLIVKNNLFKK